MCTALIPPCSANNKRRTLEAAGCTNGRLVLSTARHSLPELVILEDEAPIRRYTLRLGMSFFSKTVGDVSLNHALKIRFVAGCYAVSRLPPNADIPDWLSGPGFKAAISSDDETTFVCLQDRVPESVETEKGWACLRSVGPFPFDAAGVVQSLVTPLSSNGIGVFVVCTYDGEHVLIPASGADQAVQHLEAAGHVFVEG